MSAPYTELIDRLREVAALNSAASLLNWDQETMMPERAGASRAEELALLARLAHERATDDRVGEWIERCREDDVLAADPVRSANLREIARDYERARKLP
ncbi:MAG TPA: hypothetical protein VD788_08810, partial [Candidatus Polarisedimenticolaceae bacterium]|nr:hypothetical protein [Candidatus Polarisedimenticolaceae bacterium]